MSTITSEILMRMSKQCTCQRYQRRIWPQDHAPECPWRKQAEAEMAEDHEEREDSENV